MKHLLFRASAALEGSFAGGTSRSVALLGLRPMARELREPEERREHGQGPVRQGREVAWMPAAGRGRATAEAAGRGAKLLNRHRGQEVLVLPVLGRAARGRPKSGAMTSRPRPVQKSVV